MVPITSLVLGAALASGAAAAAQDTDRCVQVRSIDGYSVIDDRHAVLNSGASRHYLVTTRTRCSGLRQGVALGTSFGGNQRICNPQLEYLTPEDGWRCAIETIEEVESREAAESLIEQRAAQNDEG